ncbi:MAG: YgiQ family radical SAM protein, partial [Spirochaetales bacterium]|nr:YgiQ family radical SAM protein [Spirochaetales bacterium]
MAYSTEAFLPATRDELLSRGWDRPDIILVTGDAYIDSPLVGTAVIGRVLEHAGYRVAVIPQPATDSEKDITRLGEPKLFWGVTSGCVDSLVSNYTALKKRRRRDDYTAGGLNNRRPDRSLIVYTNLIRRYFKNTVPIVLGGIEAGTRRIAHYDFWSDSVRRSVLFDAKADILVYGMGEKAVLEIAQRRKAGLSLDDLPGTCSISRENRHGYAEIPSYESVVKDRDAFSRMFKLFTEAAEKDESFVQLHGDRYLLHHRPAPFLRQEELDALHALPYRLEAHPIHQKEGPVRALETIRFSLVSHRGCYGGCSFCSISVHQGSRIISRSESSIVEEGRAFTRHPRFKGIISDVGGPTANMYMTGCSLPVPCSRAQCLFPQPCPKLNTDHSPQLRLLENLRQLPGVRHVFIASGLRHDLVLADPKHEEYINALVRHHVSGQCKTAPEHVQKSILKVMRKPLPESLLTFKNLFDRFSQDAGKKQFLTYYFIAAHPGCTLQDM